MNNGKPTPDSKVLANFTREFNKSRVLIWRLFTSPEVPIWVKGVPILSLLYWVSPADALLIPFLGITPIDDVAVILLGLKLFVELCPTDLVDRLRDEINYGSPASGDNDTVIDATYHILDDDQ